MEVKLKINRLYVRGFGKIETFDETLSNGLNVIYGHNESGKSTLMAFIKAMLYGLKGGRASETKQYKPWNKAPFGGYLNFELDNGREYRIDRDFENGIVKLFDGAFNDITGDFVNIKGEDGIADRLLGLNESLFERTVYIKQMGTRIDNSASKDLLDRISNIRQSGWEDISFKNANAALKEALKQQVGTDRSYTRPLDLINKRLGELSLLKTKMQEENKSLIESREKQKELAIQISKLAVKEKLFASLLELCGLKRKIKLQNEKQDEIDFLNERIKQAKKDINTLSKDKELLEQNIDNNSKQLAILDCKQEAAGAETINLHTKNYHVIQDKLQKQRARMKAWNISSIIALIALLGIGSGALVFNVLEIWITAIPVIAIIIFVILWLRSSKTLEVLEDELSTYIEQSKNVRNELDNLKRIEQILNQQRVSLNERFTNEKNQYEQLVKRLQNHNNFKQEDVVALEKDIDRVSELIFALRESTGQDLNQTEKELYDSVLESISESQCIKITEIKEYLTSELQQKKLENATVEADIKNSENIKRDESIDDEIVSLTQQKESLEQRGEALSIAIQTLEEATNAVQKKYIPVMNKVFKDTFKGLTAQKYNDIRAGDNLSIMISEPQTQMVIPVSVLSNGTIDQLYLALRMAISETVLRINEGLPFIMDEPFAQYDDERTENALSYIYNISKKQQVIIFTCKKREVDLISSQYPCKICSLT